jgi:hypothetical protein
MMISGKKNSKAWQLWFVISKESVLLVALDLFGLANSQNPKK